MSDSKRHFIFSKCFKTFQQAGFRRSWDSHLSWRRKKKKEEKKEKRVVFFPSMVSGQQRPGSGGRGHKPAAGSMQILSNLEELEKCCNMNVYSQKSVSIQPRTSPQTCDEFRKILSQRKSRSEKCIFEEKMRCPGRSPSGSALRCKLTTSRRSAQVAFLIFEKGTCRKKRWTNRSW